MVVSGPFGVSIHNLGITTQCVALQIHMWVTLSGTCM